MNCDQEYNSPVDSCINLAKHPQARRASVTINVRRVCAVHVLQLLLSRTNLPIPDIVGTSILGFGRARYPNSDIPPLSLLKTGLVAFRVLGGRGRILLALLRATYQGSVAHMLRRLFFCGTPATRAVAQIHILTTGTRSE